MCVCARVNTRELVKVAGPNVYPGVCSCVLSDTVVMFWNVPWRGPPLTNPRGSAHSLPDHSSKGLSAGGCHGGGGAEDGHMTPQALSIWAFGMVVAGSRSSGELLAKLCCSVCCGPDLQDEPRVRRNAEPY